MIWIIAVVFFLLIIVLLFSSMKISSESEKAAEAQFKAWLDEKYGEINN